MCLNCWIAKISLDATITAMAYTVAADSTFGIFGGNEIGPISILSKSWMFFFSRVYSFGFSFSLN